MRVNIGTGATTFTGVPDLPLSDLKVVLSGGPNSIFAASCAPSAGTASAALTSQNGDKTATSDAAFKVAGCATGGGSSGGGGSGAGRGRPSVTLASISRLGRGLAILRLRVLKGHNAPAMRSVAIELPRGLTFRRGRAHGRPLTAVHVTGAQVASDRLVRGRLLIVLKHAVDSATIRVQGIRENAPLERRAKRHRLHKLKLGVGITDASDVGTLLRVIVHALSL